MNKKITVLTPFYPIRHRKDIFEDTKAIYYLIGKLPRDLEILIVHSFVHGFKDIPKYFYEVLPIKKDYKNYLYKDNYGNIVMFIRNLLLIPKSIYIPNFFNKNYAKLLKNYFEGENYNSEIIVVHFPSYYKNFLEYSKFNKKIAIVHSFDIKNIKKRYSLKYWKEYYNSFDKIGFRSSIIQEEFEKLLNLNKKYFLCYSGLPEHFFEIDYTELILNKNNNLMFAGRLDKNKNVDTLIKVFAGLNIEGNLKLNIIGDGPEKNNLTNQVNKYSLNQNVDFLGKLSRDETLEYMRKSHIFIMVSKKETLGLVYLEAMTAGCIVIGTKGQGIDGIIINGFNGYLVDSEDLENIKNILIEVLTLSKDEINQIRSNAINTVKEFTESNASFNYYENIIETLEEK